VEGGQKGNREGGGTLDVKKLLEEKNSDTKEGLGRRREKKSYSLDLIAPLRGGKGQGKGSKQRRRSRQAIDKKKPSVYKGCPYAGHHPLPLR